MPLQVKRLVFLFVIFILLFLTARYFLVPESFGQYGHYRGDALMDNSSREPVFSTTEECSYCHDDIQDKLENEMHAGLSCLICHGPGLEHVNEPTAENIVKESGREFCGKCHNTNAARSLDNVFQVDIKTHHIEEQNCVACHNPHSLWEGIE